MQEPPAGGDQLDSLLADRGPQLLRTAVLLAGSQQLRSFGPRQDVAEEPSGTAGMKALLSA
jgi:hypothetical protein